MADTVTIETTTHGRVLVEEPMTAASPGLIVAFHGYGQNADDVLAEARQIPGASAWRIAAVQALHRFYARDHNTVVASWMTAQDRELAIADNIAYIDAVVDRLQIGNGGIVFLGFSQGASMAYRAALLGRRAALGVIALGGDIPPELMARPELEWPRALIGAGNADRWYDAGRLGRDDAWLSSRGVRHEVCRFDGGHEWTPSFRAAASVFLASFASNP